MIVIDENVDQVLINMLNGLEYEFYSIRDHSPGINDREVIEVVEKNKAILLTEDKDFGELVFAHNIRSCSVILLRYHKNDYKEIFKNIRKALKMYERDNNPLIFFTITKEKIRMRRI
ncbi:MAG: DUF5615 family PIN-like protein [Balneolaceae bacterium]|nr:DUF5615 family PIN-like protein [Balneolaceae bacterium]